MTVPSARVLSAITASAVLSVAGLVTMVGGGASAQPTTKPVQPAQPAKPDAQPVKPGEPAPQPTPGGERRPERGPGGARPGYP